MTMRTAPTLFAATRAAAAESQLAISVDTLVEGVHFDADTPLEALGYKCVAVNLSDMAAMGATPLNLQCAWSDPLTDLPWREAVTHAIKRSADAVPMSAQLAMVVAPRRQISIQIVGEVPDGNALTRSNARVGDQFWVSGTLGDAGGGLGLLRGHLQAREHDDRDYLLQRLHRPSPRLALGRALRGIASAAIDISDGIAGDALHIAARSKVGIRIFAKRLPLSAALLRVAGTRRAQHLALGAGEDYELAFSAPARCAAHIRRAAQRCQVAVHCIGDIVAGGSLVLLDEQMRELPIPSAFDHFADRESEPHDRKITDTRNCGHSDEHEDIVR
ncbi:MAG: thiamine-monophosphate kinase [Gammaproteobacteria bacterium]|jgi:thiamine-monophosphate kinase